MIRRSASLRLAGAESVSEGRLDYRRECLIFDQIADPVSVRRITPNDHSAKPRNQLRFQEWIYGIVHLSSPFEGRNFGKLASVAPVIHENDHQLM